VAEPRSYDLGWGKGLFTSEKDDGEAADKEKAEKNRKRKMEVNG